MHCELVLPNHSLHSPGHHRDYNASELTSIFLMSGVDPSSVRGDLGILQLAPGELPDLVSSRCALH